jgi:hypothetical protein
MGVGLGLGRTACGGCLCRMYAPPTAVSARGYGVGGGMRRCDGAAAGSGGGMSVCTAGSRDRSRYAVCGCCAGRGFIVGLRRWGSGTGGWRYGRVGPIDGMRLGGGSGWGGSAMLVGAERACAWVACAEGWAEGWTNLRRGWFGVWGMALRMRDVGVRDVGWWCGMLVCGDGSMWTRGW